MRLELSWLLFGPDIVLAAGTNGAEPSDGGCEIQSSERESIQAFSIVKTANYVDEKCLGGKRGIYDIVLGCLSIGGAVMVAFAAL